jgi:glycerophosphoryl diester phosphodiesterase
MPILLDPEARLVVAHRGNSACAPENTLEALEQGVAVGADALEFDVRITRDGQVVLLHDPTVDRSTNGTGPVASLTLGEVRRLDAGFRFTPDAGRTFPWRARGITIPTLSETLDAFRTMPMILEIKTPEASSETRRLLARHDAAARCLVGSFNAAALAPFRGSGIAFGASRREVVQLYARTLLPGGPRQLPFDALVIPPAFRGLPLPVLRFARMARRCDVPTHVWTVDDPGIAGRYWDGGVNGIISNDPARILAAAGRARGPRLQASIS